MSLAELKASLYSVIDSVDDEKALTRYLQILVEEVNQQGGTFTLTPEQKIAVAKARASLDAGKGVPHEVVKERFKKKYPGIIKWE